MSELAKNPSTDAPPIVRFDRVSKHFKTSTGTTIALQDINKPIGVAEYQLLLPKDELQELLLNEIKESEKNNDEI
mgnify:CR=1 FL=1